MNTKLDIMEHKSIEATIVAHALFFGALIVFLLLLGYFLYLAYCRYCCYCSTIDERNFTSGSNTDAIPGVLFVPTDTSDNSTNYNSPSEICFVWIMTTSLIVGRIEFIMRNGSIGLLFSLNINECAQTELLTHTS